MDYSELQTLIPYSLYTKKEVSFGSLNFEHIDLPFEVKLVVHGKQNPEDSVPLKIAGLMGQSLTLDKYTPGVGFEAHAEDGTVIRSVNRNIFNFDVLVNGKPLVEPTAIATAIFAKDVTNDYAEFKRSMFSFFSANEIASDPILKVLVKSFHDMANEKGEWFLYPSKSTFDVQFKIHQGSEDEYSNTILKHIADNISDDDEFTLNDVVEKFNSVCFESKKSMKLK
jgi:hypothetical protein